MVTKTTIADNRRQAVHIVGSDNLVTLTRDASVIVSTGAAIYSDSSTETNDIVVQGHVFGASAGVEVQSRNSTVKVAADAEVVGANGIMFLASDNLSVINAGTLNGTGDGYYSGGAVFIYGAGGLAAHDVSVENSGRMFGYAGVILNGDCEITNDKAGKINGTNGGIAVVGGVSVITNHGVISAHVGPAISASGDFSTTIINDGKINGDINLYEGNDKVDNRGGTLAGQIFGGTGNDVLITDDAHVKLSENTDEGLDVVRSTVSYTLNDNVEMLRLIGKANINGTATDTTNTREYLYGNSGNNVLNGLGGNDVLDPGDGKDTMLGGQGLDLFVYKKGYGVDTVQDFHHAETDHIILYFKGVSDISDLDLEQHKKDTWIEFGHGDTLILKHVNSHNLVNSDFGW